MTVRWNGCAVTSSTCRTNPQHNETIDVFYIKKNCNIVFITSHFFLNPLGYTNFFCTANQPHPADTIKRCCWLQVLPIYHKKLRDTDRVRWLVAGLSPLRPTNDPRSVRVGSVVHRVSLQQFSLLALKFSPVSIVPPILRTHLLLSRTTVAYPGIFFGGVNKFSWGQRERGSGDVAPLVRGSGDSCNLVQQISFHIVKFS